MPTPVKRRNPSLDVIRCLALLCVVSAHFFANTEVFTLPVNNAKTYLMCLLRSASLICVPLFLLLSGYLMGTRMPTRQYYRKLWKTLAIYLLASACCGAYQLYASIVYWASPLPVSGLILGLFSFQTAPYGWYVGMYIALFLLIPYLNILYRHLESQRQKQYLLLILLFMTALPGVVNVHNLTSLSWWLQPSQSAAAHELVSPFWVDLYPITYYLLGVYLREYPLKLKPGWNLLCIGLAFFAFGSYTYYRSWPGPFVDGFWMGNGSLLNVIQSVLVFSFFSGLPLQKLPAFVQKALSYLSDWCLGAYLVSWIFDQHVYSALRDNVPDILQRLDHYLPSVLKIYILSLALSAVLNMVYQLCSSLLKELQP